MMTQRFRVGLTLVLTAATLASAALAADSTKSTTCAELAAAYDRQADEYEATAERYRAWARAEDMFANSRYENAWELARRADGLEAAAQQSRARAAESRSRGGSTASSADCRGEAPAGAKG